MAAGKTFFTGSGGCAGCHGADGKGATPLAPPYDDAFLDEAKPLSPAHSTFPSAAADRANLVAFMNSLK